MSCNNIQSTKSFKECVYNIFCQCYNQCVNLPPEFGSKQTICSEITVDNHDRPYYELIIEKSIEFFKNSNFVFIAENGKFFIFNSDGLKLRLTWENIKNIEDNQIKELFWLFRKLIIDSILKMSLINMSHLINGISLKIFSVGSTNITSDYDITLYGPVKEKIYIINYFKSIFEQYFKEDSSIVFDTNIYGEAYINFSNIPIPNFKKAVCEQEFYYLEDNKSNDSTMMWVIVRFLRDLKDAFGENIYNQITKFMLKKFKNSLPIFEYAEKTLIYLQNQDFDLVNYDRLLSSKELFLKDYQKENKHTEGLYDYISVVNYYGVETYITRGAFIDTVVNSQMCKTPVVDLYVIDYICSIIENISFYFNHNSKTKYVIRVKTTLEKLITLDGYSSLKPELDSLNRILDPLKQENVKDGKLTINYDNKYCNNIVQSDTIIDILSCEKYELFSLLVNIVYSLLKTYAFMSSDKNVPIFYTEFVTKQNKVFLTQKNKKSISLL